VRDTTVVATVHVTIRRRIIVAEVARVQNRIDVRLASKLREVLSITLLLLFKQACLLGRLGLKLLKEVANAFFIE
jgi:hypothetical protein